MSQPITMTDHKDFLLDTLEQCGWQVNFEKCQLQPSTNAVCVGFALSTHGSRGPWLKVLPSKLRKLHRTIKQCLSRNAITARSLARIIGQCVSMTRAIVPAKLLLRSVYHVLVTRNNWESLLALSPQVRNDLNWWLSPLKDWNGALLHNRTIEVQMEADASEKGWGGVLGNSEAGGNWPLSVSYEHLNKRELFATYMTLQSLGDQLRGKSIQVLSDNITSVVYINRLGGSSEKLNTLMSTIWCFAHNHAIELCAKHLAGVKNVHADQISRRVSPYEWQLHPRLFRQLDIMWGPHTVDRFVAKVNPQLPRHNCFLGDPEVEAIDALSQQNWVVENNYVNPPFWLLPRILMSSASRRQEQQS